MRGENERIRSRAYRCHQAASTTKNISSKSILLRGICNQRSSGSFSHRERGHHDGHAGPCKRERNSTWMHTGIAMLKDSLHQKLLSKREQLDTMQLSSSQLWAAQKVYCSHMLLSTEITGTLKSLNVHQNDTSGLNRHLAWAFGSSMVLSEILQASPIY